MLDEEKSITTRWDSVIGMVRGMGRAIMSTILMVAHPDRYGVWNNTSEAGLKTLGLWPDFGHGRSSGEKYAAVNRLLIPLAKDLGIDLWTLDALFWRLKVREENGEPPRGPIIEGISADSQQGFGLERHLHDFLFEVRGGNCTRRTATRNRPTSSPLTWGTSTFLQNIAKFRAGSWSNLSAVRRMMTPWGRFCAIWGG
jgi:hypothetical protein